jgi:hypothetical protein
MFQRAQKGLWNGGNVPFGYDLENKKLIVNSTEADRLRFMFHRFCRSAIALRFAGGTAPPWLVYALWQTVGQDGA